MKNNQRKLLTAYLEIPPHCIGYLARQFQRQGEKTVSVILQPPTTRGRLMPAL
jgi:hypothetical protein